MYVEKRPREAVVIHPSLPLPMCVDFSLGSMGVQMPDTFSRPRYIRTCGLGRLGQLDKQLRGGGVSSLPRLSPLVGK